MADPEMHAEAVARRVIEKSRLIIDQADVEWLARKIAQAQLKELCFSRTGVARPQLKKGE